MCGCRYKHIVINLSHKIQDVALKYRLLPKNIYTPYVRVYTSILDNRILAVEAEKRASLNQLALYKPAI